MGDPLVAMEVALTVTKALDDGGIPCAIGGALAFGMWGTPRATVDVDINVFVEESETPLVVAALTALGAVVSADQAVAAAREDGMFFAHLEGMRIDVFTPSIPFSWEALRTRVRVEVAGRAAWFLSAEATAVFKMLFFRAKDIVDLQRLIAVRGQRLDVAYVRRWLVDMVSENDERIIRWDQLVRDHLPALG